MSDPKDVDGKSKWAPGEMADGSIDVMSEKEAAASKVDRDADEEAFDRLIEDEDDLSDLDDPLPEEG